MFEKKYDKPTKKIGKLVNSQANNFLDHTAFPFTKI